MSAPLWIHLDGAENVRDVGGLPTEDGRQVQPGRLIRSDSLQELSDADVRHLVDDLHVRAVADLRTGVELASEGPGPISGEPFVRIVHLSLYPESDAGSASRPTTADAGPADAGPADAALTAGESDSDAPVLLPWQARDVAEQIGDDELERRRRGASGTYLRYLDERADSVIAALRLVARTDGATIVHCAAGKDRTGVVVAIALREVGVLPEAVTVDYARSGERIEAIYRRLGSRRTYAADLSMSDADRHRTRAVTMERLLEAIDEAYGGVGSWLRANGWTADDAAALRHKLLD